MPGPLVRLSAVSWLGGALLPGLLLWHGIWCVVHRVAFLPDRTAFLSLTNITGKPAVAMGIMWIALAIAVHAHFFWNRIEPHWRWAPLPRGLGVFVALLAFVMVAYFQMFG